MERPKATHIKNKPTILMKNITSHKLNSAGFPDFSPNMSTMSAKMTKNSHKSKVGAKKTRSATNNRNRSKKFVQVGHENTSMHLVEIHYIMSSSDLPKLTTRTSKIAKF